MNQSLYSAETSDGTDDLRALAWVQDEVRKSLEAAHKALRRQLKEAESLGTSDVDTVDPSVLRGARNHLHQAAGALALVGLSVPAQLVRASESTVQRMIGRASLVTPKAVDTIEHTSFAVLDFVARRVAGKQVSGVALFPQYRAVQELAVADRVHPADLWSVDWRWREIDSEPGLAPRVADAAARETMERMMLRLMRKPDRSTLHRMSDLCAELGAGAAGRLATVWKLGAAFFEAQSAGLLRGDVFVKRAGTRLLAQARASASPDDASDRLAHDLLFFCARAAAPSTERPAPRLEAVRRAWDLAATETVPDYETSLLGRFDPALIAQARKRVSAARDAWSAVAGDDLHRVSALGETFALVGDSLRRLYPNGELLAQALSAAVQQTVQASAAPPTPLAMEVATSVLYLEASLEDAELDHPDLAERIECLARRVDEVRGGAAPQPLEAWMEEIYRRVSDRQTMGSVVQELRSSLSEVEKQIDQYFRDPSQRELLYPVPGQLSAMRGVLSVLGMDQASQAVLRMRDDVDALAQTEVDPQQAAGTGTFERLAESLGALSFLIDVLGVQPQLAKSLFRYDAASGRLQALMGKAEKAPVAADTSPGSGPGLNDRVQQLAQAAARGEVSDDTLAGQLDRLSQQALIAEERTLAQAMASAKAALASTTSDEQRRSVRSDLAQAVQNLTGSTVLPAAPKPAAELAPAPAPAPGDDSEMREIFIEEAREVVQEARDAMQRMAEPARDSRDDLSDLTVVRRAFHTLKGSSRMVGLNAFGEAAWACEQLYNARLAQGAAVDDALRRLTGEALDYLADWVDAIADGRDGGHRPAPVVAAADALRLEGRLQSVAGEPGPATPLDERVPDLPAPFELDLDGLGAPAAATPSSPGAAVPAPHEPDALPNLGDVAMPEWEPEPADIGMAATLPLMQPYREPEPPPAAPTIETIQLDLGAFDAAAEPTPEPQPIVDLPEPVPEPVVEELGTGFSLEMPAANDEPVSPAEEPVKVVGPLRIDIAMFNIYLNEADELSRRLSTEIAEWAMAASGPPGDGPVVHAHSLAGSSATVGFSDLSALARAFEHALMRSNDAQRFSPDEPALYTEAADDIRRLLHQFAAGFLKTVTPGLIDRLESHEPVPEPALPVADVSDAADSGASFDTPARPAAPAEPAPSLPAAPLVALEPLPEPSLAPAAAAPPRDDVLDDEDEIDATDAVDEELFPIFADEAEDLVPQLQSRIRDWMDRSGDSSAAAACMRTLHTFKGGARLAGAMRVGEMAHRLETTIERLLARGDTQPADIEPLLGRVDAIEAAFLQLRAAVEGGTPAEPEPRVEPPTVTEVVAEPSAPMPLAVGQPVPAEPAETLALAAPTSGAIDWSRFAGARAAAVQEQGASVSQASVRVRAPMLDRLVGQAGEVSIARARIESDVGSIKSSLGDLTENLERMRRQLRDIEVQAESQIGSRMEAAKAAAVEFDPLEMDRYTRFQELTRMMAESVNDVATVQRGLQRSLQSAEDQLAAQARLTRSLQDDLLRTRMVEFDALADRLYRVVRQAAKETGKQVRLDIVGGATEVDRGVLDRMTGPFEHLLRNSVTHGIELPEQRAALGKDATGAIQITLHQEGNEVALEFRDDGAGLDLPRIRERGIAMGLIDPQADLSESALVDLIFAPGFSTARELTGLAGRGIGMDVVRSEVVGMGGRIETASTPGQGTRFRMVLPLTTAVTQVVLLRCGELTVAVPSTLIDVVRRVRAEDVEDAYVQGQWQHGDSALPFFWLGALLDGAPRGAVSGRSAPVVVIRSAAQRVALHVDEVQGNQEVVVKNLGPQLARLPGLAGVTLLPSGAVAPIYNPVALAALYGQSARDRLRQAAAEGQRVAAAETPTDPDQAPLVLVVDDSLTVRRVTQRLLVREGYRVITAKDGLEALERLAEERPAVLLSDIEMPRMDGFDLVRNLRADPRLADLPVIMITSRIAQKHRDYAAELGVDHYLGKPYGEDELLALVARYARHEALAAPA